MKYVLKKPDGYDKMNGLKYGDIFTMHDDGTSIKGYKHNKTGDIHYMHDDQFSHFACMPNREFLSDFIKLNKIKKTLVSKYLGMAENWLTTMVNEKRATRKDISDATLQEIMRKLHIDWTSQEFIHVKKTKSNIAYKTKPCNYSRMVDKERLQKAMWSGELI